jgi:hypothetical protein
VALSDGETASIKLRDGTELRARRGAVGAPSPAPATVEAKEVSNCQKASADAACVAVTQLPGFRRVQLTTAEQAQSRWVYEDLELTAVNPRARRVRWNVSLLPK